MVISQVSQGANTERGIVTAVKREVFTQEERTSSRISQLDGPIPDPYDDVLSTPNVSCRFCLLGMHA